MPDTIDDLVVVLPGIGGSVLARDGHPIWDHSLAAARRMLPPGRLNKALALPAGIGDEDPQDGVEPTGLIGGLHLVPGLWKISGYDRLLATLRKRLDFSRGNLVEFAYDWRLSCRVNAQRLHRRVEEELGRWRQTVPDARVSYVCHSMGGLIARYHLEVLGGRDTARNLITIGTPHAGAGKAAAVLSLGPAHGARARLGRFGSVLDELHTTIASFPSVHQLLPVYRCIDDGSRTLHRLAEVGLAGIQTDVAHDGAAFHQRIKTAVTTNRAPAYKTFCFGGHRHAKTIVTVRVDAARITPLHTFADDTPGGDGTVPRFSAVGPEALDDSDVRFGPARHTALAEDKQVIDAVHAVLTARTLHVYMDSDVTLGLDLPEITGTSVPFRIDVDADDDRVALVADAVQDQTGYTVHGDTVLKNLGDGHYTTQLVLPAPGAWNVTVRPATQQLPVIPVSDVVLAVQDPQAD